MKNDPRSLIEQLDSLLEQERKLLLTGRLEAFPRLLSEKDTLLKALEKFEAADLPDLDQVQMRFKYNQNLLEGAMRGIRSTAERLKALSDARDSLETYDQSGQIKKHSTRQSVDFEKRA